MEMDGIRPDAIELVLNRVQGFWHRDEHILYIGKSDTGIRKRVRDYYTHRIGNKGSHTGGHWLKLFRGLDDLFYYYAIGQEPEQLEKEMLLRFAELHCAPSQPNLYTIATALPFANLHVNLIKPHGITNMTRP
jgi:hypothetical protein